MTSVKRKDLVTTLSEPPLLIERQLAFDQWVDYGKQLKEYEAMLKNRIENYQMLVGAWYNYGVEHWKRPAERAARQIGYSPETIHNWAWVERRIPASLRGDGFTFEDYRAVAALPTEAERAEWLERKKREGWSGGELRRQIAETRGNASPRGDAEREQAKMDALTQLIDDLIADGEALLAKDDEMSRAQGDVYLDCANRIRSVIQAARMP